MTLQALSNPDDFKKRQPGFAEPKSLLNPDLREQLEKINSESTEIDGSPVFSGYDVLRVLDFRGWQKVPGRPDEIIVDKNFTIPISAIRVVGELNGKLVHACYEKVFDAIDTDDLNQVALALNDRPYHWLVSYRYHDWEFCDCSTAKLEPIIGDGFAQLYHPGCGRYRKPKAIGNFGEHVASLNMGMPDEDYNGYYPTIPGDDVAHFNSAASGMGSHRDGDVLYGQARLDNQGKVIEAAQPIRGGSEIRGGRSEWREKTKGLISWDSGTQKALDNQKKQAALKRKEQNRIRIELALNKGPVKPFEV